MDSSDSHVYNIHTSAGTNITKYNHKLEMSFVQNNAISDIIFWGCLRCKIQYLFPKYNIQPFQITIKCTYKKLHSQHGSQKLRCPEQLIHIFFKPIQGLLPNMMLK